jgi:hypothetical protein
MGDRRRHSFRPDLEGLRLEERKVLSTTAAPAVVTTAVPLDATTAAPVYTTTAASVYTTTAAPVDVPTAAPVDVITAAAVDPLVPTNHGTIKQGYLQQTQTLLHSAFKSFLNSLNRAGRNDVNALARGQSEATLLAGYKAYVSLEGGILESKVQRVAGRLPGGVQYLFNPPQGTVPGGYPTNGTSGPDLRYYVHPDQRLKTQIDSMLASLNANATSLQNAVSPASSLLILQTFQNSKAAMKQYATFAEANGDFTAVHG